jgi:hypothetical protein
MEHKCIHDQIDHKVWKTKSRGHGRKLINEVSALPIRIHFHTDNISYNIDEDKRNFLVNQLIPAAQAWYESWMKVERIAGNLILESADSETPGT